MTFNVAQAQGSRPYCNSGTVRFAFTLPESDFLALREQAIKNGRTIAGEIRMRIKKSLAVGTMKTEKA